MKEFDKTLYEATMVAVGKILSKYNVFSQGIIMRDLGKDIIHYLDRHELWFEEAGDLSDLERVVELFLKHGFADKLEVAPADQGDYYTWHHLYLLNAYKDLQDITGNPFISCPLNLCLSHICAKHDKFFKLHQKTFDMERRVTISQWELVDTPPVDESEFDPLVIENVRLIELADEREIKLLKAHAALEQNTAELTAAKQQAEAQSILLISQTEELINAREIAERAAATRSDFLANMSHEIRTPMNGVVGMAELLSHTKLNDEQQDYVRTISNSSEALLDIINSILDLSKIEAGKMTLASAEFDPNSVIEETIDLLASKAEEKQLEFIGFGNKDLPSYLIGDPARLRQILVNLAANAIKFTNEGQVQIRANNVETTSTETALRFSVSDTGIGIEKENQKLLFSPFYQVGDSMNQHTGGTGLGLSISQQLVVAMGGQILLESKPGKGSTFSFTLKFPRKEELQEDNVNQSKIHRALIIANNSAKKCDYQALLTSCQIEGYTTTPELALQSLEDARKNDNPFAFCFFDTGYPFSNYTSKENTQLLANLNLRLPVIQVIPTSIRSSDPPSESGQLVQLRKPIRQSELSRAILQIVDPELFKETFGESNNKTEELSPPDSSLKILVIDDQKINLRIAEMILKKQGYEAELADSGEQALLLLEHNSYDIIFMDCLMPKMDGYETTRAIRKSEKGNHHQSIIAMTASALLGDRGKCLEAGMDDYLAKPVKPKQLMKILKKWGNKG